MSMIIVLTICMVAVYFFVMRPNSKKRKEMQNLLNNLSVGDEVLTNGGIAGRISRLPDNKEYILVTVAGGIELQMKRNYVVAVLPKGTLDPSIRGAEPAPGKKLVRRKKAKTAAAETAAPEAEAAAAPAANKPEEASAPAAEKTDAAPADAADQAAGIPLEKK